MCVFVDVKRVSHSGDVHDLDGCQLPRLNMATLVEAETESDNMLAGVAKEREERDLTFQFFLTTVENIWGTFR